VDIANSGKTKSRRLVIRNCICGKPLKKDRTYCSNSCQKKCEYINYIYNWKQGKINGMRGKYQISLHITRYLFEKYNYSCSICKWNFKNLHTGKIPLEVEHIDGNYLNNSEANLTLLCPNCHSLTATYKGANKGKGRTERAKYTHVNPELGNLLPSVETLHDASKVEKL